MQADKLYQAVEATRNAVANAHNELGFHFYRYFMTPPPMTPEQSADAVVAAHSAVQGGAIEAVPLSPTYQGLRDTCQSTIDGAVATCQTIAGKKNSTHPSFGWDNYDTAATSAINDACNALISQIFNYAQTIEQEFIDNGGTGEGGQPINP